MDESSIYESSISNHSISLTTNPKSISTSPVPERLHQTGSGTSTVINSDTGVEAESGRKLPSSRFKGVVPQPNGRWGAQIYENHQRVWLGTFDLEEDAAKAYDIAARRFRGRDAITNFSKNQSNHSVDMEFETNFLNSHSTSEIVEMLRKHTYSDELKQSNRNHSNRYSSVCVINNNQLSRDLLFEKTVTPSDVGKLNRLVIPKQHAEKHFPLHCSNNNGDGDGDGNVKGNSKVVLLNFEDVGGKVWRFRYSYWNSSQSYVLTKGWSRFVKEKGLSAGDIVRFQRSAAGDRNVMYIDWKPRKVVTVRLFGVNIFTSGVVVEGFNGCGGAVTTTGNKRNREFLLEYRRRQKQRRAIDAV